MFKSLLAAAALAIAAPAAPALADHAGPSVRVELGIHDIDHRRPAHRSRHVDRREAIWIASRYGLNRVYDVNYRRGVWEVTGGTHRGGRIEVKISALTGRVLDVDYGRGRRGFGDRHHDRDWRRGW